VYVQDYTDDSSPTMLNYRDLKLRTSLQID
jgi:hypothetical protein